MLLGARFLANVNSVNSYDVIQQVEMAAGDQVDVYLQLVDASLDRSAMPPGRRYVPAPVSTLQVVLLNINSTKTYAKTASQPFPTTDPSIWIFSIAATDAVKGTVNVQLVLGEGAVIRRGLLQAAIRVSPVDTGV